MKTICELSSPVDLDERPSQVDFEYSKIECDYSALYEYVENPTTSAYFYLEKSFTYGDFFVMGFLTMFLLFGITKLIWDTFIKR